MVDMAQPNAFTGLKTGFQGIRVPWKVKIKMQNLEGKKSDSPK
jgi:hypothetical protein